LYSYFRSQLELIHVLIEVAGPYYVTRHIQQKCGFERGNLETSEHSEVETSGTKIPQDYNEVSNIFNWQFK